MFFELLAQAKEQPTTDWIQALRHVWWLPVVFIIMYVLLIAPQRKKEKRRAQMLKSVKKNDKVVTIGGVHGVVKSLTEDEVVIHVDESKDIRLKLSRWGIREVKDRADGGELSK